MKNVLDKTGYSPGKEFTFPAVPGPPSAVDKYEAPSGKIVFFRGYTRSEAKAVHLKRPEKFHNILTNDKKMHDIFEDIKNVADFHFPVHIYGATGTGKELIARAIHDQSSSRDKPFVTINCGALPEGILESELFGHEKGAFSGAVKSRKGRFELADGGTLFLDEVAELSKHAQVKLLRVVQESVIEKVGGEKPIPVDVRIISATNKKLKDEIKKGNFRNDLYYRLNVFPIALPSLSQRRGDIVMLAEHFIREICHRYNKEQPSLSKPVHRLFEEYNWPGNIRELQNAVSFSVVRNKTGIIRLKDLPLELLAFEKPVAYEVQPGKLDFNSVKEALTITGWNKTKTAEKLHIGRATLYRFLQQNSELMNNTTV